MRICTMAHDLFCVWHFVCSGFDEACGWRLARSIHAACWWSSKKLFNTPCTNCFIENQISSPSGRNLPCTRFITPAMERLRVINNLRVCLFKGEMLKQCARTPRIRSVNNYHAMLLGAPTYSWAGAKNLKGLTGVWSVRSKGLYYTATHDR